METPKRGTLLLALSSFLLSGCSLKEPPVRRERDLSVLYAGGYPTAREKESGKEHHVHLLFDFCQGKGYSERFTADYDLDLMDAGKEYLTMGTTDAGQPRYFDIAPEILRSTGEGSLTDFLGNGGFVRMKEAVPGAEIVSDETVLNEAGTINAVSLIAEDGEALTVNRSAYYSERLSWWR